MTDMIQIGKRSKEAQRILAAENSSKISAALNAVANALERDADYILGALYKNNAILGQAALTERAAHDIGYSFI